VFTGYERIAIAAVLAFATEEKPFVAIREITPYARNFEKNPKLTRFPTMMKKALKKLVDQTMFKGKKDFSTLTSRGRARAHGNVAHASTASNPKTPP
jgi:hypothetical protein